MLCGLTVLTLVLALTLQKDAPVIAFLLALAAGVLILTQVFGQMGGVLQRLGQGRDRGCGRRVVGLSAAFGAGGRTGV